MWQRGVSCAQIDEGFLSAPSAVEFPTEGGLTAFMNYYSPKNKARLPPSHGMRLLLLLLSRPSWTSVVLGKVSHCTAA